MSDAALFCCVGSDQTPFGREFIERKVELDKIFQSLRSGNCFLDERPKGRLNERRRELEARAQIRHPEDCLKSERKRERADRCFCARSRASTRQTSRAYLHRNLNSIELNNNNSNNNSSESGASSNNNKIQFASERVRRRSASSIDLCACSRAQRVSVSSTQSGAAASASSRQNR